MVIENSAQGSDVNRKVLMSELVTPTSLPPVAEVMQRLTDEDNAAAAAASVEVELTLAEAVERIEDGSRIDPSSGATWDSLVAAVTTAAVGVATLVVSLSRVRYDAAMAYGKALAAILLPNGVPDWGGKSDASKVLRKYAIDAAMDRIPDATQSQRDNERNAIVKQYVRNVQELLIRDYVARTASTLAPDGTEVLLFPEGPDDGSTLFTDAVRKQYLASGIGTGRNMPKKYRNAEDDAALQSAQGGPGTGPSSALETARKGIDGLKSVAIRWHAVVLLSAVTGIARRLEDRDNLQFGGTDDRAAVGEVLHRIAGIAHYSATLVEAPEKVKENDREGAAMLFFNPDADNPDRK